MKRLAVFVPIMAAMMVLTGCLGLSKAFDPDPRKEILASETEFENENAPFQLGGFDVREVGSNQIKVAGYMRFSGKHLVFKIFNPEDAQERALINLYENRITVAKIVDGQRIEEEYELSFPIDIVGNIKLISASFDDWTVTLWTPIVDPDGHEFALMIPDMVNNTTMFVSINDDGTVSGEYFP